MRSRRAAHLSAPAGRMRTWRVWWLVDSAHVKCKAVCIHTHKQIKTGDTPTVTGTRLHTRYVGIKQPTENGGVSVHFGSPLWPLIGHLLPSLGFWYLHTSVYAERFRVLCVSLVAEASVNDVCDGGPGWSQPLFWLRGIPRWWGPVGYMHHALSL